MRSEVKELIRDQEKAEVSRAERLLERLEQEIAELRRRDAELEQFSHTEDDIHFLQSCQATGGHLQGEFVKISQTVNKVHILEPRIREDFLQYSCQLTLDPNTANRHLRLSEGNRERVQEKRKWFKECGQLLRERRMTYTIMFPAILIVNAPGGQRRFEDLKKAQAFIR
ncbi:hypothetical protein AAFF_G00148320 [Aldrovandia affinis]|uniref:TRIM8/14/16/25/29/45/65 coiled-coil region domain-containing protein n=1 Tax=Aldrovandia affinis TaxID=143900 RepID=A0AAD7VXA4_9TELE|nr:hypothetical protein AAFF_G00148320 [Aldrovandia affinis]